jgi:hypothetical protein
MWTKRRSMTGIPPLGASTPGLLFAAMARIGDDLTIVLSILWQ